MRELIGLMLILSAIISEVQPIAFEWSVEDAGRVTIDVPLENAESFFFNTGLPLFYSFTIDPPSKRTLRKQKRAQKDYDNSLVGCKCNKTIQQAKN